MKDQSNLDYKSLLTNAYISLKRLKIEKENLEAEKTEPIAIIGMSCRFPSANSIDEYWELLKNGIDAISDIPSTRWNVEDYFDKNPDISGKMYTRKGGFIENMNQFDAKFYGIAPKEANQIDPQQRLLLDISWEALENAFIVPSSIKNSDTGVFIGLSSDDYGHLSIDSHNTSSINAYSSLGTARSIAAGRLAYFFGLQGPVMQLDTACSSSLLSIHLACQSLRNKECNMALAGGVNLLLSPNPFIAFSKLKALAKDGKCKVFDAKADGYVRGEGCAIIVLKRLSDAIMAKDNILAVIKQTTANHDGASNGLTAPNGTAQEVLLKKTLEKANIKPQQVQYVEAHGTGTSLGDPIEVFALGKIYGKQRNIPLYVGSVKSNIGHLEASAGIASLIKVVLSIIHKQIPPSLHFNVPNPLIPWEKLNIEVANKLFPWPAVDKKIAGVSAFGMSGTNVHALIEEAPVLDVVKRSSFSDKYILALSSKTSEGVDILIDKYINLIQNNTEKV